MLPDVVEARPAGGYRVYIRFDDGVAGEVDLAAVIDFEGVFAPLRAPDHGRLSGSWFRKRGHTR